MAQQRPIGAGDIAAAHRFVPQPRSVSSSLALAYCLIAAVAPVERLLQQLRPGVAAAGQHDADDVKLVVVRSLYPLHAQPREHLPQFGVRQAGPDDRAVQGLRELPDLCFAAAAAETRPRKLMRSQRRASARGSSCYQRGQRGGGTKTGRDLSGDTFILAIS